MHIISAPTISQLSRIALLTAVLAFGATRAEAQTTAYVTNTGVGALSLIDTATDATLGTISVGLSPSRMAITSDGTVGFVTNGGSDSISVIDLRTAAVTATIAVGDEPSAIAVTPNGQQLYVIVAGGVVQVIDTKLRTVVASIAVGGSGGGIGITPDGSRAYVGSSGITVIDTATRAVLKQIAIGQSTAGVAISPDGARAFFATTFFYFDSIGFSASGGVVVVDTATNVVLNTIDLGAVPSSLALTPDGKHGYAAITARWVNSGYAAGFLAERAVAVIDTITNTRTGWIDVLKTPADLAVTPDGTGVYVTVPGTQSVAVIDTASDTVATTIPVSTPNGVAIAPYPRRKAVTIDVRPGSTQNRVSPRYLNEILPVAIMSTRVFDARSVAANTVRFGAKGTEAAPVDVRQKDVDGDGDVDLLFRFRTVETGIQCGAISSALTGQTLGGKAIAGSDRIQTVNCN